MHRALREIHERADAQRRKFQQASAVEGQQFLDNNQQREEVNTTESGLQFSILKQGEGPIPAKADRVRVHYTGRLIDGTIFDCSREREQPAEFPRMVLFLAGLKRSH